MTSSFPLVNLKQIVFECTIYHPSGIVKGGRGGGEKKISVWAGKGLTEFHQKLKELFGKPVPELFLKGPQSATPLFLSIGESLAIIFYSEHVNINEITETTIGNETYFQEHNLQ